MQKPMLIGFMLISLVVEPGDSLPPGSVLLQPTRGDERRDAVRVFAVMVPQEALAFAGLPLAVDVHVVLRGVAVDAHLLDQEAAAEVGRNGRDEVVTPILAD